MTGTISTVGLDKATLVERLLDEGPIGMAAAARLLGTFRSGRPCHPSTPTRWAIGGIELPGGRVLRLESARLNGRLITTKAALVRFIAAQQAEPAADPVPEPVRPASARMKASTAAEKALIEMGA